jgi:aminopeptidase N
MKIPMKKFFALILFAVLLGDISFSQDFHIDNQKLRGTDATIKNQVQVKDLSTDQYLKKLNPDTTEDWHSIITEGERLSKSEARRYMALMESMRQSASEPNIDVTYYKLNLSITTSPNYIHGVVTMKAISTVSNLASITLDFSNASLVVDSVKAGSTRLLFAQQPLTLIITLDQLYGLGESVTVEIYYHGAPPTSIMSFVSHAGKPWIYTNSEPFGAREWWPCKNHPSDKADSVDIWVTVNNTMKVGSNGKLVAVIANGDGTKTYQWAERYPISTYLVSLAITDYAEFTNWWKYTQVDSLPVLNYVLPEHLSIAQTKFDKTIDMLRIYSDIFGLYPFIKEKYGHAEWAVLGAVEYQTMTSLYLNFFDSITISHELSHSWFGDGITCATWPHIWMSEGFATYSSGLYLEKMYGTSSYLTYMNENMIVAKRAQGSIYVRDPSNASSIYNWEREYAKGATVLHMLRHILGDSVFFHVLKSYAEDTRFMFGTVTTEEFKTICEQVSGKSLQKFFQQWIYEENYPYYAYGWSLRPQPNGYDIKLRIDQIQQNTGLFWMPIDIKVTTENSDTTFVVLDSLQTQEFDWFTENEPVNIELDVGNWILKETTEGVVFPYPFAQNVTVNNTYQVPGTDTLIVISKTANPDNHNLDLMAIIESYDQGVVDSVPLFDDGNHIDSLASDGVFGGFWPVIAGERSYNVHVKTLSLDSGYYNIFKNAVSFTTNGPLVLDGIRNASADQEVNPGDRLNFKFTVRNNGSTGMAVDVMSNIFPLDTCATASLVNYKYGNIAAGTSVEGAQSGQTIRFNKNCGDCTARFAMKILSNNYPFWTDTFTILVREPVSIEDISEPLTRIYPNPTENILNIELNNADNQPLKIEIFTVTGEVIYQKDYKNIAAHFVEQVDLSGYTKGIYLVKVKQDSTVIVGKVVVR